MFIDKTLLRTAKGQSQVPALQSCVRTRIVELDIVRSLAFLKEELYEVLCLYRTQKTKLSMIEICPYYRGRDN